MNAPARKRRPFRWLLGGLLLAALGLYLARDPIATKIAHKLLTHRGTHCEALAVHVGWGLQSASIDPTTCARPEGRVSQLGFPSGASLELAGIYPRRAHAEVVQVELREGPEGDALEGAGLALFDQELARGPLLQVSGALANFAMRDDRPDFAFDRVELSRDGRALVATAVQGRRTDEGMLLTVSEVAPRGGVVRRRGVEVAWKIRAIEARITPAEVDGRASVVVDASLAGLARQEEARIVVRGRGLDTDAPEVALDVTTSPAVRALRARARELRERLWERVGD